MTSRFEKGGGDTTPGKYAGPSIVEMMEKELDKARVEHADYQYTLGLATAIGILRVPYSYLNMKPAPLFSDVVENMFAASNNRIEEKIRLAAEKAKEK
jgi:hypothetical protein